MINFLTKSTEHLRRPFVSRQAPIGSYEIATFADGELGFKLLEDITRKKCTLISSIHANPATLFQTLASFKLLRENKASNIDLVIPYLGYARQDQPTQKGEGSTGIMIAELMRNLNANHIYIFDPHSVPTATALGPNTTTISVLPLFANELCKGEPIEVIVGPDKNALSKAEELASMIEPEPNFGYVEKERPRPNIAVAKDLNVDVKKKHVVIIDDMIDTGGTIIEAVDLISRKGPASIRVCVTHGIFSDKARDKISKLPITDFLVSNTINQPRSNEDFTVIDISPLILELQSQ